MSTIEDIAAKHGFSADAGRSAYASLQSGGFSQAQFSHPELLLSLLFCLKMISVSSCLSVSISR